MPRPAPPAVLLPTVVAKAVTAHRSLRNADALPRARSGTSTDEMRKAAKRLRYAAEAIRPCEVARRSGWSSRSRPSRSCSASTRTPWWPGGCCASWVVRAGRGRNGFAFGWPTATSRHAPAGGGPARPHLAKLRRRARAVTG